MEEIKDRLQDGFQQLKETLGPMQKYVTPTSALVGLGAGLSVYWLIKRSKYNLPPGPTPLPLVGNYKLMVDTDIQKTCLTLSQTYGPVLTIYMGMSPMVIVNTIEAALELLVKSKADFANRPVFTSGNAFSEGAKDIAFAQYTPTLKLHRKIASTAMRNYLKGDRMEAAIHGSLSQLIELFENLKEEPFVPHSYLDLGVFNIICGLCFQHVFKFDDPQFKHLVDLDNEMLTTFGSGFVEDLFPILAKVWPSSRFKKVLKLIEELLQFFDDQLQYHKKSFSEGNIRDFTDALIQARRDAEIEEDTELLNQLTDVHLRQTIADIFFAGFDTVRFTLQWFLLYMAEYQEVQKQAQKEIDKTVGRDRLPRIGDRGALPYTEAALYEVMRIATTSTFGFPHAASVDSKLCGYDIPKGTMIMINHWALHMDPNHWENPTKFDPERFLDSDGKLTPKPISFLPFSAGRRACLGESAAKQELNLICACILQQFDILLPPGVTADFSPNKKISGLIGYTATDYKLVMKKRV